MLLDFSSGTAFSLAVSVVDAAMDIRGRPNQQRQTREPFQIEDTDT